MAIIGRIKRLLALFLNKGGLREVLAFNFPTSCKNQKTLSSHFCLTEQVFKIIKSASFQFFTNKNPD
jgi:hypothetical protein